MMKKVLAAMALSSCLALALGGCGGDGGTASARAASSAATPADVISQAASSSAGGSAPEGSVASSSSAPEASEAATSAAGASASTGTSAKASNGTVAPSANSYSDAQVDVDLTKMSSTAVYSAVYQLMVDPQSYTGQVVKMQGAFYTQYDDRNDKRYCFILVKDATACCSQGLEFVWDDDSHAYPDDYPAEGTEAVVCGKFETYKEGGATFAHLVDSSLQLA